MLPSQKDDNVSIPGNNEADLLPVVTSEAAATTNEAVFVPATVTESDEESMVVVTPPRDYYITREKFVTPVQETSQSASAELVLSN